MNLEEIRDRSEEFMYCYMNFPKFLDEQFELPDIFDLLEQPGVLGVARFIEQPSFDSERLYTLVYRQDSLEVSAVVGASSLWNSNPQVLLTSTDGGPEQLEVVGGYPFDPQDAFRKSATLTLPASDCPPLLASWNAMREAAAAAGNCSTDTFDGIGYSHRAADQEFRKLANWSNPVPTEHPHQLALIDAYVTLLRRLELYPR